MTWKFQWVIHISGGGGEGVWTPKRNTSYVNNMRHIKGHQVTQVTMNPYYTQDDWRVHVSRCLSLIFFVQVCLPGMDRVWSSMWRGESRPVVDCVKVGSRIIWQRNWLKNSIQSRRSSFLFWNISDIIWQSIPSDANKFIWAQNKVQSRVVLISIIAKLSRLGSVKLELRITHKADFIRRWPPALLHWKTLTRAHLNDHTDPGIEGA